jgi:hypothetical protein
MLPTPHKPNPHGLPSVKLQLCDNTVVELYGHVVETPE